MTIMTRCLGLTALVLAFSACGTSSNDPCDGAKSGTACRWAGTGDKGFNADNPVANRLDSTLYFPTDLTFGPDGRAYVVDWNNHMIRRVNKNDTMETILGTDYEGDGDPDMNDRLPTCNPKGALGTTVAMNHPTEARFGPDGLLYVAAWHNNKIRTIDTATGYVKTVAGDFYGYSGDGGPMCAAIFNQPKSITWDAAGNMYIIDQRNVRIRRVGTDQVISTIAGDGKLGNVGDGGPATAAEFGFETIATPRPSGALAIVGNLLYVADSMNNRIRRIHLDTGMIDCIAGASAQPGYTGDGGPAINATFNFPMDLEIGPDGRLYVDDRYNNAVRAIDLNTGIVETVVGNGQKCDTMTSKCPDKANATDMELNEPYGIAFDAKGNLYVADTNNNRILKVIR